MAGRGNGPDFVEALARGLDILAAFGAEHRSMSLSEVAAAAGLARPTARRLLLTLEELGFVRSGDGTFELTPKVMNLGMAYVSSLGLWDIARPHMEALVARTGESSSMAQLDGSDIVYVARVSVPKLIALRVEIGTHFPAAQTSQGKVLLAALPPDQLAAALAQPSRSGLPPRRYWAGGHAADQLRDELAEVRARGWALADEELAPGVRSVAVPVRDGTGKVRAAMNVTVHAAETTTQRLLADHLPPLLTTAGQISAEWAIWLSRPHVEIGRRAEAGPVTA
jgi:IclR family transcriptional regulator, pca regulon regulatory protein